MNDPREAALLVIDMQNGFINPTSALCVAGAQATVDTCAAACDHARKLGMPVFFVRRVYAADGSDVEAVRYHAWVEGGRPLSPGCPPDISADFPPGLTPAKDDYVVDKPRFSAFFGTGLDAQLRRLGVRTVVLAGTTTPNCVRSTCYDALSLDYNVAVLEDCTSSRTPAVQTANIEDMRHIGAHILSCATFCANGLDGMSDTVAEAAQAVRREHEDGREGECVGEYEDGCERNQKRADI